jgi:16S rRNA (cytosine967-C5)-methyltransferase
MKDATRNAAFDLLLAVLERQRPLDEALGQLPPMETRDRAAAHRLAAAVLRWRGTLDAVVEPFLRRTPPNHVRYVLLLALAGIKVLETPDHAAVTTAVELARARGLAPFTGLINAVLRRVIAEGAAMDTLDSARLDTPAWLWASWGVNARAIANAHHHEAPLDVTVLPAAPPLPGGTRLPTGTIRFPPGTRPADLPGFEEGSLWVQDAAAALPARLLGVSPGTRVLDMCAAPGGKTAQLAATGADVTAIERDPARASVLRQNLDRLRQNVRIIEADASVWRPSHGGFDAVLLDAPCSATGTIRRHPDILHLKRQTDIDTMARTQRRLLEAAVRLLRPGGKLVYAVCSLQPQEGSALIETFLEGGGLAREPVTAPELPSLAGAITARGDLQTHPGLWAELGSMDGFFAARLVRL